MKKITALLLAVLMLAALAACRSGSTETTDTAAPGTAAPTAAVPTEAQEACEITYNATKLYADSIGTVWAQTIVEITNTGSVPLYLSSGAYDLEDASGALIAAQTMVSCYPDVVSPGEKGYMYEETTLDKATADMQLTAIPRPDIETAKVDDVQLTVSGTALSDGQYGGLNVIGRVENTTGAEQSLVYVVAVFYAADGTPLGLAFNIITETMAAGDKIGFEINSFSLPDDITAASVDHFTVVAYPQQYQF